MSTYVGLQELRHKVLRLTKVLNRRNSTNPPANSRLPDCLFNSLLEETDLVTPVRRDKVISELEEGRFLLDKWLHRVHPSLEAFDISSAGTIQGGKAKESK